MLADRPRASHETRLSTGPGEEYAPQVVRHGKRLYVAWYGSGRTFVVTSADGGENWGAPTILDGVHPAIAVAADGSVHLSYEYAGGVYYAQSNDSAQTFPRPVRLGAGHTPDIALDAGARPYIVWQDQTNIVLARPTLQQSPSAGPTTANTTTIVSTTTVGWSEPPKVAVSPNGGQVYVIWECPPVLGEFVRTWFTRSTNGGDTFEPRFNPTGFTHHGEYSPDVAAYGERHVYIFANVLAMYP